MSEKIGADEVYAFDNNPWAIEVAKNTILLNHCSKIKLDEKEIEDCCLTDLYFDVVLANLNFSVFENEYKNVANLTNPENGLILVSGIMLKGVKKIIKMYQSIGFREQKRLSRDGWMAILFERCINE